eukprot:scaffold1074_cov167-Ochromonas_danica.AAC.1
MVLYVEVSEVLIRAALVFALSVAEPPLGVFLHVKDLVGHVMEAPVLRRQMRHRVLLMHATKCARDD